MKKIKLFSSALLLIASITLAQGTGSQGTTDARSMGMGKTFTSSFGVYALSKNPANVYKDSLSNFELVIPLPLPNISGAVGSNFISLDDYNYYFGEKVKNADGSTTGRVLTETDKNNLKNIFKDGGTVYTDISINWLAFSVQPSQKFGAISFSISDRIAGLMTFPKNLIDLGLDGNLPGKVYNFNDTELKSWWLRKYSIAYARDINFLPKLFKNLDFGFSLNFVSGFYYLGIENISTELTTGDANVITGKGNFLAYSAFSEDFHVRYDFDNKPKQDAKASAFPTPAGNGIGLDFGLSAKVNSNLSVNLSVTDIGKIKWNKNVAKFTSNAPIYLDDITDKDQIDTLVDRLTGSKNGEYINSINTNMATALHLGVMWSNRNPYWRSAGKTTVALEYHQGFNNQPGNTKKARVVLGFEYTPTRVIGLRTGFSFGGFEKFNWALGLGFDFGLMEMNFGTPDFQNVIIPNEAKRITFGFDSRWKF